MYSPLQILLLLVLLLLPSIIDNVHGGNIYNVKDYGATGNGWTDDTNACNSAIYAAGSSSNNVVYFPAGEYRITSILITAPGGCQVCFANFNITGDSMYDSIISLHGQAPGFNLFSSCCPGSGRLCCTNYLWNIGVSNLRIDGSALVYPFNNAEAFSTNVNDYTFTNVSFTNVHVGIAIDEINPVNVIDSVFVNNWQAIRITSYPALSTLEVSGCVFNGSGTGIFSNGGGQTIITDNTFSNNQQDLNIGYHDDSYKISEREEYPLAFLSEVEYNSCSGSGSASSIQCGPGGSGCAIGGNTNCPGMVEPSVTVAAAVETD